MRLHLTYHRYSLPFRTPVRTAHRMWTEREGVIVQLIGDGGRMGYGEAAPIPWFGTESLDQIEAALATLGEWVTPEQLAAVPERLGCLRFALAGALDGARASSRPTPEAENRMEGERKSKPGVWHGHPAHVGRSSECAELTGKIPVPLQGMIEPLSYLPVAALLPAGRAVLTAIAPKAELGFRTFKWKVGVGDLADELSLLDDVVAALPSGAKLRLDANGAWDARQASRWLERAAERPIEFIEQPCFADVSEGAARQQRVEDTLRGLAEDFPTPLALDESLVGANDIERWLAADWRGVFVIKPALLGDPAPVLERLAAAKADVVFSSALETAVGARAALQAAFSWRVEKPRALGFGVYPLFNDNTFDGPFLSPFFRVEDVARLNSEAVWNALT